MIMQSYYNNWNQDVNAGLTGINISKNQSYKHESNI